MCYFLWKSANTSIDPFVDACACAARVRNIALYGTHGTCEQMLQENAQNREAHVPVCPFSSLLLLTSLSSFSRRTKTLLLWLPAETSLAFTFKHMCLKHEVCLNPHLRTCASMRGSTVQQKCHLHSEFLKPWAAGERHKTEQCSVTYQSKTDQNSSHVSLSWQTNIELPSSSNPVSQEKNSGAVHSAIQSREDHSAILRTEEFRTLKH